MSAIPGRYVDQIDEHIPVMTVHETLAFAKACREPCRALEQAIFNEGAADPAALERFRQVRAG